MNLAYGIRNKTPVSRWCSTLSLYCNTIKSKTNLVSLNFYLQEVLSASKDWGCQTSQKWMTAFNMHGHNPSRSKLPLKRPVSRYIICQYIKCRKVRELMLPEDSHTTTTYLRISVLTKLTVKTTEELMQPHSVCSIKIGSYFCIQIGVLSWGV